MILRTLGSRLHPGNAVNTEFEYQYVIRSYNKKDKKTYPVPGLDWPSTIIFTSAFLKSLTTLSFVSISFIAITGFANSLLSVLICVSFANLSDSVIRGSESAESEDDPLSLSESSRKSKKFSFSDSN